MIPSHIAGGYLLGIIPPANVTADLTAVQRLLFRDLGECGAYALPPVIPLVWTETEVAPGEVSPSGGSFVLTGYGIRQSCLTVGVDWERTPPLRYRESAGSRPDGPILVDPAAGFAVLSRLDAPSAIDGNRVVTTGGSRIPRGAELPPLPAGTISVYRLASIHVRWATSAELFEWCRYEVVSERWVKHG